MRRLLFTTALLLAACGAGDSPSDLSAGAGCPDPSVAQAGGACSPPLSCDYGFELGCTCVAPENRWLCCHGAGNDTAPPTEGGLCCLETLNDQRRVGPCSNGVVNTCICSNHHYSCTQSSCDGGI